jgi:hypothetical protein
MDVRSCLFYRTQYMELKGRAVRGKKRLGNNEYLLPPGKNRKASRRRRNNRLLLLRRMHPAQRHRSQGREYRQSNVLYDRRHVHHYYDKSPDGTDHVQYPQCGRYDGDVVVLLATMKDFLPLQKSKTTQSTKVVVIALRFCERAGAWYPL